MQMVRAGGLPVLDDGERLADEDNPRGYLEDARTRRLWEDTGWLAEAAGKAVKIVCPLARAIPFDHDVRLILIERDLDEVIASQAAMLRRRGGDPRALDGFPALIEALRSFKRWVRYEPNIRCLALAYRSVLDAPAEAAARIASFLDVPLDREAMARAVDPALHRRRS
jgi:hypothetical protein